MLAPDCSAVYSKEIGKSILSPKQSFRVCLCFLCRIINLNLKAMRKRGLIFMLTKRENAYEILSYDGILIGNELYTVKEWEKLVLKYRVSEAVCDIVNISPKETYWFFGARFQDKEE